MLVGIMSDSHGDVKNTRRAIELLLERGSQKLFHCGDLCSDQILDELAGHDCTFVWGNCDEPNAATRTYVERIGLAWPIMPVRLTLSGKRIAVYHGHELDFSSATQEPGLDYLFYGHTHRFADQRQDGCRFINPGALHAAAVHTVALLDLKSDALKFLRLDGGEELVLKR